MWGPNTVFDGGGKRYRIYATRRCFTRPLQHVSGPGGKPGDRASVRVEIKRGRCTAEWRSHPFAPGGGYWEDRSGSKSRRSSPTDMPELREVSQPSGATHGCPALQDDGGSLSSDGGSLSRKRRKKGQHKSAGPGRAHLNRALAGRPAGSTLDAAYAQLGAGDVCTVMQPVRLHENMTRQSAVTAKADLGDEVEILRAAHNNSLWKRVRNCWGYVGWVRAIDGGHDVLIKTVESLPIANKEGLPAHFDILTERDLLSEPTVGSRPVYSRELRDYVVLSNDMRVLVTDKKVANSSCWAYAYATLKDKDDNDGSVEGWFDAHDEYGDPAIELVRGASRFKPGMFCEVRSSSEPRYAELD